MQATLIYNPQAGGLGGLSSDRLLAALREAGYSARYRPTRSEGDLGDALAGVQGLVVVAGGDGTLRAVSTRLVGSRAPVFPLPLGTANNVCKALGIRGSALSLIAGLKTPTTRPLDLGHVSGPWGEGYFLEALGFGLFAEALERYDPEAGKSVFRGLRTGLETLLGHRSRHRRFSLDGRDLSGDYLVVEVLNTPATGSRLRFAPDADPGDGLLDVVCVREGQRGTLLKVAKGLLTETLAELPGVEVYRGKHLELAWDGFPLHLDAKVRAHQNGTPEAAPPTKGQSSVDKESVICIDVVPEALTVWLPESSEGC